MPVKHKILLSPSERDSLTTILKDSKVANHKRQHAQILLSVDQNMLCGSKQSVPNKMI